MLFLVAVFLTAPDERKLVGKLLLHPLFDLLQRGLTGRLVFERAGDLAQAVRAQGHELPPGESGGRGSKRSKKDRAGSNTSESHGSRPIERGFNGGRRRWDRPRRDNRGR